MGPWAFEIGAKSGIVFCLVSSVRENTLTIGGDCIKVFSRTEKYFDDWEWLHPNILPYGKILRWVRAGRRAGPRAWTGTRAWTGPGQWLELDRDQGQDRLGRDQGEDRDGPRAETNEFIKAFFHTEKCFDGQE